MDLSITKFDIDIKKIYKIALLLVIVNVSRVTCFFKLLSKMKRKEDLGEIRAYYVH